MVAAATGGVLKIGPREIMMDASESKTRSHTGVADLSSFVGGLQPTGNAPAGPSPLS